MRPLRRLAVVIPLTLLLLSLPHGIQAADYLQDIRPVLKAKCYSCHGALKQEGGLRVDTVELMRKGGDSGAAVSRTEPTESLLWDRVSAADPDERMPPEGKPLSAEQLAAVREWLNAGATAPPDEKPQPDPKRHWAFQPLKVIDTEAGVHPIDFFIDEQLQRTGEGLSRSGRADSVTLVRRMFLDLHGLPPTTRELDRWVPALSDPNTGHRAAEELVEELLSRSQYGERWAQHWLDIVRYADTHGFEVNTPRPNAWPYRDYVIAAFNNDVPYDQFVREQLVGDRLNAPAATGFLVAAAALLPGQIGKDDASKRQARQDELDEIIVGTTATFLGLTVGCARCHDHKFDPITQEDYYAFQAFFAGVDYGDREIRDEAFEARVAEAEALQPGLNELRAELSSFQPPVSAARTIIIDDEDLSRVSVLSQKNGHGVNPEGTERGYRDDVGDSTRFGNLSGGRYTWWTNVPGTDVFTWNPKSAGEFRIWVSWGVHGSGVHTHDARYVLDLDGDLTTKSDQQMIATADQYRFVGVTEGTTEKKPMWSGLLDAGTHRLTDASRIILRCGDTGTGITADVIVLQEPREHASSGLPQLRAPLNAAHNIERIRPTEAKFVRFTSFSTVDNNKHEPCIDELEVFSAAPAGRNPALAEHGTVPTSSGNYSTEGKHQLRHINDGRHGNDFSWISDQRGTGWVQLEFPRIETINRIEWGRDRTGRFSDRLPIEYRIETSPDGIHWKLAADSSDRLPFGTPHDETSALLRNHREADSESLRRLTREITDLEEKIERLRKPDEIFAGRFRQPDETFLLRRGDPEQPDVRVNPHMLTALSDIQLSSDRSDVDRRRALADWITAPDNPLTARIMVNRIWQYHFGTGIVETPSDFGMNGAGPRHPELLDRLAHEFIRSGWSVKHLHRLIMSSETYQQKSSAVRSEAADALAADADNRLLWHFPSRRLEAEAIRDSILHVSGKLSPGAGGPGFDFFSSRGGLSGFTPIVEFRDRQFRRMIYAHKIRMEPVPIFGAFDCPDAGLPTPRRSQSTTAIQALNLFNSSFVIEQAEQFAARCEKETDGSGQEIEHAFRLALGRPPSPREQIASQQVVTEHGLPTLCRVLFNSNEFLFLP